MSFQAMTWACAQELPCNQKMVLLMLANRTNHDTGTCHPSHDRLAVDCGLSKSTVKDCIGKLESAGLLKIVRRVEDGVHKPNVYTLVLDGVGCQPTHPVAIRPRVGRQPTEGGSPAAPGVGRQPTTNQEEKPAIESGSEPTAGASLPDWLDRASWDGFVAMRKAIKKPLTGRALELAMRALEKLRSQGQDANAVLDQSTLNNWQGLFPVKDAAPAAVATPQRLSASASQTMNNAGSLKDRLFGGSDEQV